MVDELKTGRTGRRARAGRPLRDAAATRQALLEAGTAVFAEGGFKGATAERIARRAGVNKAMINYHFRSKKGLYEAILLRTFSRMRERLVPLRDDPRSAPERLREYVAVFGDIAGREPSFPAVLLREVLSGGRAVGPQVFAELREVLSTVREIVSDGVREGSLRPVDPLLTHLGLIGALVFFFATEEFRRRVLAGTGLGIEPPTTDEFVRHMQDVVTHGLAAPHGRKQ